MPRILEPATLKILKQISARPNIPIQEIFSLLEKKGPYKEFYNTIFRLAQLELIKKEQRLGKILVSVTEQGLKTLGRFNPLKDGVWKIIIFDIPEKQKYVRAVLRAKLKSLHFKKWQNSIWVSPYALEPEIEQELEQLGKKFFVRLIKTSTINNTEDLEKLFP